MLRPHEARTPVEDVAGFRRVLLPLDGSAASEQVIGHAINVAGVEGVRYVLLRVLAAGESPVRAALPRRGETPSSRAGLERLVLGSVADKVLRGAERPLLVWNPTETAG